MCSFHIQITYTYRYIYIYISIVRLLVTILFSLAADVQEVSPLSRRVHVRKSTKVFTTLGGNTNDGETVR